HGVDTTATASLSVDPITSDDLLNASEAASSVNVSGTVGGDAALGDSVTFSVNGSAYSGAVIDLGGGVLGFSIAVAGSDLAADTSFDVSVSGSDAAGNPFSATATSSHGVDTTAPTITANQTFSYAENHTANSSLGTVGATDTSGVTGYRFAATGTSTSADGFFAISNSGVISLTNAGAAAGAASNDFETGANTFILAVQAVDAAGNISTATNVTLNVTNINEAPTVAAALTAAANEDDASFNVNLLTGASDVDIGDVLSVSNVQGLSSGLSLSGNTLSVDPSDTTFQSLAVGETRDIIVSYDVIDGNGGSVSQSITVTITGTNDTPVIQSSVIDGAGVIDKPQGLDNHSIATAINLDGSFTLGSNPDVGNSETVPFVSISSIGDNAFDYYAFTVTQAGTSATFDIDYGYNAGVSFDPWLNLYDANGNRLAYDDDSAVSDGGGGSVHAYDSYLTYTFSQPGTYYIAVGRYAGSSTIAGSISTGGTYQLQVSLPNAIMSGTLVERADGAPDENTGSLAVSGSIGFTDVDLSDSHSVSSTLFSTNDSLNSGAAARGSLTAVLANDSTGDGSGSISWTYNVDASALDDLAEGQVLTLTYRVSVNDGHGGVTFQDVVITLNGTNDAPVAANASVGTGENTVLNSSVPVASDIDGTINANGYALVAGPGAGNGSLTFNP
ncbi:DVUA0089 family protein, partial [Pseudomonas sp. 2FE]|uniref:DVUA0089 family protein n=1 Tax=Pseudomonas sp. 2FE TaxID=2502190 RepID=UPI0010F563E8